MTSSDLGALGAKDGSSVDYTWVPPGIAPLLLPWLVILGLLALKPNRNTSAWWIWLPFACVMAITLVPPPILPSGTGFLLDFVAAMAVGLAATWLLSDYLRQSHRLLTFMCVLFTLAGFSALAAVAAQGFSLLTGESLQIGIVLAVAVPASAVALSLCGLICRGCYRPAGLYLWMFLFLAAVWLAITMPFFLFVVIGSSGNISSWVDFFIPVLAVATVNFVTLLPFLILSSANSLFCERLKALLHVNRETPLPVNVPPIINPPA